MGSIQSRPRCDGQQSEPLIATAIMVAWLYQGGGVEYCFFKPGVWVARHLEHPVDLDKSVLPAKGGFLSAFTNFILDAARFKQRSAWKEVFWNIATPRPAPASNGIRRKPIKAS